MGVKDPPLEIHRITLPTASGTPAVLDFHYEGDTKTTLVVPLPRAVGPGEAVTVQLELTMHLPPKQGRWGQWQGVTTLSNWLPVLAYFDDQKGWQPTPFVPWHQPFFNEAGIFTVRAILPCDQKIASSGFVVAEQHRADGLKQVEISAPCVRDFAFLCSARYVEYTAVTKAGRTFTGLLAAETATGITLRSQEGKEQVLLRSELDELQSSGKSLMPEGLEKDLPLPDMADLLAFLRSSLPQSPRKVFAGNQPELVRAGADGALQLRASNCAIYGTTVIL